MGLSAASTLAPARAAPHYPDDPYHIPVLRHLLAGIAALVLVLLVLNWLARTPAKFRGLPTPTLRHLLRLLYVQGLDGAYLQIDLRRTHTYVRVYKTIVSQGVVRLSVHVPPSAQELVARGAIERAFREDGFESLSTGGAVRHDEDGDLVVDCGAGIMQATVIVEFLLRRVFRIAPERDCVAFVRHFHVDPRAHPGFDTAPPL